MAPCNCECFTSQQIAQKTTPASPSIESEPHAYRRHVALVVESRQLSFKENGTIMTDYINLCSMLLFITSLDYVHLHTSIRST